MPLRLVSSEKTVPFQNRAEEYATVYCFDMTDVSVAAHEAVQDAVVAAEKPLLRTDVKFTRTRVFTTKGLNGPLDFGTMYSVVERNTFGTVSTSNNPYGECAVLVKWPLDRMEKIGGGLGRQRSLKKWIRGLGSHSMGVLELSGVGALTSTAKAPFVTYANAIEAIANADLCSPGDGERPNGPAIIHPYLEHRQFPRGRKES